MNHQPMLGGIPARSLEGRTLGAYQIKEFVAEGAMGVVFRGHDPRLNRIVAIKILKPQIANDPTAIHRFYDEARTSAQFNHRNIVRVYAVGHDAGFHFMAMEFLEGESLEQILLRQGALSPRQALDIICPVASALSYIHGRGRGVVHRDVKPKNIILSPNGAVTLVDFGLVKVLDQPGVSMHGEILGPPYYMSPEAAQGKPVSAQSDIYSLGVVAFEVLTGHVPFYADSLAALSYAHVHRPPPPLRSINPNISESIDRAVRKALAKRPEQRYRTANDFCRELDRAISGKPDGILPVIIGLAIAGLVLLLLTSTGQNAVSPAPSPGPAGVPKPAPATLSGPFDDEAVNVREPTAAVTAVPAPPYEATTSEHPAAATDTPAGPEHETPTEDTAEGIAEPRSTAGAPPILGIATDTPPPSPTDAPTRTPAPTRISTATTPPP